MDRVYELRPLSSRMAKLVGDSKHEHAGPSVFPPGFVCIARDLGLNFVKTEDRESRGHAIAGSFK
jgi:hypothetical protein